MNNILILGSGAREHALADKFSQSEKVSKVYVVPGNDGIEIRNETLPNPSLKGRQGAMQNAKCYGHTHPDILKFINDHAIDLVFVGSEQFLADGIIDFLTEKGIKAIGPTKAAAQIESSKVFAKDLMKRHNIPTAFYESFTDKEKAKDFIKDKAFPIVIKADGLAAGKGVLIAETTTEAQSFIDEMLSGKKFGEAGQQIVIEEFLTGKEASVFAFCDGEHFVSTIIAKDHKRAFDGDKGLNTGGMGAFAPVDEYSHLSKKIDDQIFAPTLKAMKEEDYPFTGVLFAGLMIEGDRIDVIEFNCRFGDPETQVILPLLENDILDICEAICDKTINKISLRWKPKYAVNVVLASLGYPESFEKGHPIHIPPELFADDRLKLYFAGVKYDHSSKTLTNNGGRVISLTAIGDTMSDTIDYVYAKLPLIKSDNLRYRKDIGEVIGNG